MINDYKINITAHAGCMDTRMDSIESIEAGIEFGADIIEIDLNVGKDNNLILSHDIPKEEIEYPKFKMVLEMMKNQKDILLNADVKNPAMLRWLKNVISEYELLDRVFLTGLTLQDIISNKEFLNGLHYFVNIGISDLGNIKLEKLLNELENLNVLGININHGLVTSELVAACKERKMITSVWTVDNEEDMKKIIGFNVNSITTKRLDVLKNKISEMQIEIME